MASLSSKVLFGIGVALTVAAVSSIFVSMLVAQAQQQGSGSSGGGATSTASSQGSQSQGGGQQSGSSQGSQGQQQSGQSSGGSNQITIVQGAASQQVQKFYQPDPAQVSPGSQVSWMNKDSAAHTATADDGSFDTGPIQPGQSGSATVQGQGQVQYHCTIHPFMKATLQLSGGGSAQQAAGQQASQQPASQQASGSAQQSGQTSQQQAGTTATASAPQQTQQPSANRTFYIANQELQGFDENKTGIPADVFSQQAIQVNQGDKVTIHFYNVEKDKGDKHSFTIGAPYNIDKVVEGGKNVTISFTANQSGIFKYYCKFHEPTMQGTLLVMPNSTAAGQTQAAAAGGQQSPGGQQSQQGSGGQQQGLTPAAGSQQQSGQASSSQQQAAAGANSPAAGPQSQQQAGAGQSGPQGGQQSSGGSSAQQSGQGGATGTQASSSSQQSAGSEGGNSSGSLNQALQQVTQLLSQAVNTLQQAVGSSQQSGQQQGQASGQQAGQNGSSQQSSQQGASQQTSASSQQGQQGQTSTAGAGGQLQGSGGTTITIPQGAQSGQNGYYSPANAQVQPGASVTWANKDSVAHTATAQDGSFDTGSIPAGSSGTATVQGQGQIQYYCTIHPWMTGTLTVGGAGGSQQGGATQAQGGQGQAAAGGQQSGGSQTAQQAGQQSQQGSGGQQGQTSAAGSQQQSGQASSSQQQQSQEGSQQAGGGGQTSAEGFPVRTQATALKVLPKSTDTDTGLEPEHKNDWLTANHDIKYTRTSQQTVIGKDNVGKLQVKWILNSDFPIESPPLIVGDKGYVQDNAMRVLAFDANTGLNLWKFDPGVADKQNQQLPRGVFSHGITYDQGAIFAPTGANGTIVALNATTGDLMWQSASVGDPRLGYREPMPPIVWKDYVIAGSALGDEPPFAPAAKGSITAFNRTDGEKIWNISTVTGAWVEGENAKKNGGAAIWSGGSFDPDTGIIYLPTGNAAPDFNSTSRPPPNKYTSSVIAVDIKTGNILWDTQSVSATDQHDWDTAWGTSLATVKATDGEAMKVVIAQNKRGEGFALDASDGRVLWNKTIGVEFRTGEQPTPFGSGTVWPGANYGIEDYNANDNTTAYFAASNMGFNYFTNKQGTSGHLEPVFDAIKNGIGNGTIAAVDIATGKVNWEYATEFPTWVSPAVTNGVVFSGHITATGKPYKFSDFGAVTESPLVPSGIVIALDKDTGKKLWEFNVGAPIGIGGPSIGNGMLYVTTGSPAEVGSNKGGYIVAFGLPAGQNGTATSQASEQALNQTVQNAHVNSTQPASTSVPNAPSTNSTAQRPAAPPSATPDQTKKRP